MPWECPHCGTMMRLVPTYGGFTLMCPNGAAPHPTAITWTSDNTSAQMPKHDQR